MYCNYGGIVPHLAILFQLEAVLPKGSLNSRRPDYVFRLEYTTEQEARFQELATPHGTFHAFHGSSVERFHSILHNGLLNMFNKVRSSPKLLSCQYCCSKKQSFLWVICIHRISMHISYFIMYIMSLGSVLYRYRPLVKVLTYQLTWG